MGPHIKPVVSVSQFINSYILHSFAKKTLESHGNWLPLYPSPELARIIASITTDGHIQRKKNGTFTYIGYFSDDIRDLNLFNDILYSVFNIKGTIREWGQRINGRSKAVIVCSAPLARILSLCGVPLNDKILTKFSVPHWIQNGSVKTKRLFLRRLFSCEGSIYFENYSKSWCIKYSMHKSKDIIKDLLTYFKVIQTLLNEFNVTSSLSSRRTHVRAKDNKVIWDARLRIRNKQSLINFAKKIGFDNPKKIERMQTAVKELAG